jgi:hypothetical protein
MKTVKCINKTCKQIDIEEHFMGSPELVMCGVCQTECELSEVYDDPETPQIGVIKNAE